MHNETNCMPRVCIVFTFFSKPIWNINSPPLPLYREGRSVCGPQRASAGCVSSCLDARVSGCISQSFAGCVQTAGAAHPMPPSQPRWSSAVLRATLSGKRWCLLRPAPVITIAPVRTISSLPQTHGEWLGTMIMTCEELSSVTHTHTLTIKHMCTWGSSVFYWTLKYSRPVSLEN